MSNTSTILCAILLMAVVTAVIGLESASKRMLQQKEADARLEQILTYSNYRGSAAGERFYYISTSKDLVPGDTVITSLAKFANEGNPQEVVAAAPYTRDGNTLGIILFTRDKVRSTTRPTP